MTPGGCGGLSVRLRSAIRALTVTAMRILIADEGYRELVRFLTVLYRYRWVGVPGYQHERDQGGIVAIISSVVVRAVVPIICA